MRAMPPDREYGHGSASIAHEDGLRRGRGQAQANSSNLYHALQNSVSMHGRKLSGSPTQQKSDQTVGCFPGRWTGQVHSITPPFFSAWRSGTGVGRWIVTDAMQPPPLRLAAADRGVRSRTATTGVRGAMLRAYDKTTGKQVGAVHMPAPQSGSPMTYMWNGKQFIVVAVSGGPYWGEYIAYRLPADER